MAALVQCDLKYVVVTHDSVMPRGLIRGSFLLDFLEFLS